jgi:hypothetical protein
MNYKNVNQRNLVLQKKNEELVESMIVVLYKLKANLQHCNSYDFIIINIPRIVESIDINKLDYSLDSYKYNHKIYSTICTMMEQTRYLLKLITYGESKTLYAIPNDEKKFIIKLFPNVYSHYTKLSITDNINREVFEFKFDSI